MNTYPVEIFTSRVVGPASLFTYWMQVDLPQKDGSMGTFKVLDCGFFVEEENARNHARYFGKDILRNSFNEFNINMLVSDICDNCGRKLDRLIVHANADEVFYCDYCMGPQDTPI